MTKLNKQRVLITGGASGIGFLVAAGAIDKGATVILWDIDEAALERATRTLGSQAHGYVVDITDRHAVYAAADRVRSEIGVVDVLINNAGIVTGKPFLELPDEMIEKTFQVNTISHFWTARAFLPDMLKRNRGHIVTIASAGGLVGVAKLADYCARNLRRWDLMMRSVQNSRVSRRVCAPRSSCRFSSTRACSKASKPVFLGFCPSWTNAKSPKRSSKPSNATVNDSSCREPFNRFSRSSPYPRRSSIS